MLMLQTDIVYDMLHVFVICHYSRFVTSSNYRVSMSLFCFATALLVCFLYFCPSWDRRRDRGEI